MNKAEIASYLVSLHTLMEAQYHSPHAIPSAALAAEYNHYWDLLKQEITGETGTKQEHKRAEDGAEAEGDQSRRG